MPTTLPGSWPAPGAVAPAKQNRDAVTSNIGSTKRHKCARRRPAAGGTGAVAAAGAVLPNVASKPVCHSWFALRARSQRQQNPGAHDPLHPRANTSVHAAATTGNALAVIAASISSWWNCRQTVAITSTSSPQH